MAAWKRTFLSTFAAQVISILGFSFATPFLPFFIADLGVTDPGEQAYWAGIVLAAAGLTFVLFSPLWGMLADRYGRKPMVCRAMFAGTGVMLLMSFVQTVGQLVVTRLLHGALVGTISASVALVASVVPTHRSGFTLGMMQAAVFIGTTIGPFFGGIVADAFGYRVSFRVGALLCFLGGLFVLFGAQEDVASLKDDTHRNRHARFRDIFLLKGFFVAVVIMFGVRLSNTIVNPSFPLVMRDILPGAININSITGSVMAVAALAGALSAALLGHVGDRIGQRRVLIGCCLGACLASMGHYWARNVSEMVWARILFGFSVAGMLPAANAMIHSIIDPRSLGKAYGLATSLSMLGFIIGPFVGGYSAKLAGLRQPFLITAAAQLLLALMIMIVIRKRPREHNRF